VPELPEVEAVCRRLHEWAAGRTIVAARFTRPQTTRPTSPRTFARRLAGRQIDRVHRRAKNVLLALTGDLTLRIHLRMTGNLWVDDPANRPSTARAWFTLDDGREIVFDDPRLLGRMEILDAGRASALDQELGLEPLSDAFTPAWLAERAQRSRKPAKVFLLDQSIVVGLGNIWAAEALFAARVAPAAPANSLKPRQIRHLHAAIQEILARAVKSAYEQYRAPGQTLESEGYGVAVYNREGLPCLRCRTAIARVAQAGRSTYFCPRCQR
jgi:formamidopyrimidine-DNA glycosylase